MPEYIEPYTVNNSDRHEIIREVWESDKLKPWTLLTNVDAKHKALKQLLLNYELTVDADGYIILPQD